MSNIYIPSDLHERIKNAIRFFWQTRGGNASVQSSGISGNHYNRNAVVGGKQLDGFLHLIKMILIENQVDEKSIFTDSSLELPGYFRPNKKWDLLVVDEQKLVLVLELKSQVGPSFGNNFNNRTEEAMGSALDIWTAFRENIFKDSKPWLGYIMILEDCVKSNSPVSIRSPHFNVIDEFIGSSYTKRYEIFCRKLVLERQYNAACLIKTKRESENLGNFSVPNEQLSFDSFLLSMLSSVLAYRMLKGR